ncbi:MAG: PspA/IM30 family protein [Synechococcales cyanobacterium C42_A2020_086]|jgi:phage shock protein A|nr:PspA/IM30 family protein [Synechococcales cyanobacterium M58_A2018_015]MBF2076101.1 PspA/IM30 family protein [Synechococcales cyanobacterium C42_A2020_086]
MGILDRLGRVLRSNLNSWLGQVEDPEKILEQTVQDMQDDLIRLRQAVAQAIATQKRTERQCSQAQANAEEWYRRAQLALQKGDESLAREALSRRKSFQDTAETLAAQIRQQSGIVSKLKDNMRTLETKLAEAKTKKDMYIARARSAQASQRLNEMLGNVGTGEAMAAFERMEQRVLQMEAQAEAVAEINAGSDLERRFKALERGSIDEDLEALKAKLAGSSSAASLPAAPSSRAANAEIDADLERLRARLEEN